MSHCQALEEWAKKAQEERGLIDVKFYPGPNREQDLESAAEAALTLLQGTKTEEDVTDDDL